MKHRFVEKIYELHIFPTTFHVESCELAVCSGIQHHDRIHVTESQQKKITLKVLGVVIHIALVVAAIGFVAGYLIARMFRRT